DDLCPLHGGDQLRATGVVLPAFGEQLGQAAPAIALAGPPDRSGITPQAVGDGTLAFASGYGQHDPGTLHLKPGQGTVVGGTPQDFFIPVRNDQLLRLAATHDKISPAGKGCLQHSRSPEFIAGIVRRDTSTLLSRAYGTTATLAGATSDAPVI